MPENCGLKKHAGDADPISKLLAVNTVTGGNNMALKYFTQVTKWKNLHFFNEDCTCDNKTRK
jgi:hypothetical protein